MSIEFNVMSNLDELNVWIAQLTNRGLSQATKRSMIRTKPTMKKESVLMVKKYRKAKSRAITDRFKFKSKLNGNVLSNYEINMEIERKPIRILEFIKGKKEAQKKRGIPVRKRRKLKVEVVPGRARRLPSAFIEKGSGGRLMVLQRQGKRARPTRRLTGVYIHHLFAQRALTEPIQKNVGRRVQKEFVAAVTNKMRKRLPSGKPKKE